MEQKRPAIALGMSALCTAHARAVGVPISLKRPTTEAKETYYRGKRDLLKRQKRSSTEAKETYYALFQG